MTKENATRIIWHSMANTLEAFKSDGGFVFAGDVEELEALLTMSYYGGRPYYERLRKVVDIYDIMRSGRHVLDNSEEALRRISAKIECARTQVTVYDFENRTGS